MEILFHDTFPITEKKEKKLRESGSFTNRRILNLHGKTIVALHCCNLQ